MVDTFPPLDQEAFDKAATYVTFAKVFPHILELFVSRADAKEMMKSDNLNVTVNPGQVVSTSGGPTSQVGSTVSPGMGKVLAVYNGGQSHPASKIVEQEVEAKKNAGGTAIEGSLGALANV